MSASHIYTLTCRSHIYCTCLKPPSGTTLSSDWTMQVFHRLPTQAAQLFRMAQRRVYGHGRYSQAAIFSSQWVTAVANGSANPADYLQLIASERQRATEGFCLCMLKYELCSGTASEAGSESCTQCIRVGFVGEMAIFRVHQIASSCHKGATFASFLVLGGFGTWVLESCGAQ